jgi:predicted nuclease of predicted toxin-antitoxin system
MDKAIAIGLRRRGMDVTTTPEAGLLGEEDEVQLSFAAQQERVLVTCDIDFLRLHSQDVSHQGIVFVREDQRHQIGPVIRFLELLWNAENKEEMLNRVEYLS